MTIELSASTTLAGLLAAKAPLASPTFTGTPSAPTASPGTNTTQLASTAFVTAAVAAAVTGLLDFKGDTDCSANPNYPAASKGDAYIVTVAGKIGGASGVTVDVGDVFFARADNAGGTQASVGTSWAVLEKNLVGALLAANNLSDVASPATARANLDIKESMVIACGDETTAIIAATGVVTFRMPYAFTLTEVRASLTTAQASGSTFTVDINEGGSSILSTKLTIDNTEKTSTTAATPPVISDTALADDAEITIDVDQIGNGSAKGLKVALIGRR